MSTTWKNELKQNGLDAPSVRLDDRVELVLGMQIAKLRTETELQNMLDMIDDARDVALKERSDAAAALSEVQKRMRSIQARYVKDQKPTVAERQYKADEGHSALEALSGSLNALITYCDSINEMLRDKYFRTLNKLKGTV